MMEAQASWACGLPVMTSFQEQDPWASSQEEEGPSVTSWEGLPCGVQASYQSTEEWETGGTWTMVPVRGEAEIRAAVLFSLLRLKCFVNQVLGLLFRPSLVGVSHVLCVSYHCSMSFSQMENQR